MNSSESLLQVVEKANKIFLELSALASQLEKEGVNKRVFWFGCSIVLCIVLLLGTDLLLDLNLPISSPNALLFTFFGIAAPSLTLAFKVTNRSSIDNAYTVYLFGRGGSGKTTFIDSGFRDVEADNRPPSTYEAGNGFEFFKFPREVKIEKSNQEPRQENITVFIGDYRGQGGHEAAVDNVPTNFAGSRAILCQGIDFTSLND